MASSPPVSQPLSFWEGVPLRRLLAITGSLRRPRCWLCVVRCLRAAQSLTRRVDSRVPSRGHSCAGGSSPPGSATRPVDILVSTLEDSSPTAGDASVGHALHLSSSTAKVAPGAYAAAWLRGSMPCCRLAVSAGLCRSYGKLRVLGAPRLAVSCRAL